MGLIDIWRIVRQRWLLIVAVALVCTAASAAYAQTMPTTYSATSSMYVSMATGTSVNDSYQGGLAAQQRVRSYLDLATSTTVAARVVDDQGLRITPEQMRAKITVSSPPATTVIIIAVQDSTPTVARNLADATVAQFRTLIDELESIQRGAAPAARVAVVDRAAVPSAPIGQPSSRLVLLGLIAGLALGTGAAFVRERTDRSLRTSAAIAAALPVPVLGVIDEGRPGAEGETRRLRSRLRQYNAARTVHLTSLSPKSEPEVAMALACSLADSEQHVLLIDADTSGGGSSSLIPSDSPGIAAVLRGTLPIGRAMTPWSETGIAFLPLGAADNQTPDLLASGRFIELLADLTSRFDHVIVETAPVTVAAEAICVAPLCDVTVGIVESGALTTVGLRNALSTLGESGLTGVVVYSKPATPLNRFLEWLPA
ncbi:Wzz/FepE/Etk N-terminal domain-containing protein [Nocardia sp. NPDC058658]|uniref:Wzz/FepE/Etk N-terminal domain-containing protein n=1 Tax=Nocardia sp. NPDC058658 TaxID=3346580 RepID=UPI00364CE651